MGAECALQHASWPVFHTVDLCHCLQGARAEFSIPCTISLDFTCNASHDIRSDADLLSTGIYAWSIGFRTVYSAHGYRVYHFRCAKNNREDH